MIKIVLGKVERYLHKVKEQDGIIFFGLIDPTAEDLRGSVERARAFDVAGADVILVGGSLGSLAGSILEEFVMKVNGQVSIPVMLYPGDISGVTGKADALYYMSLMNSTNPYWITGAQALSAPQIQRMDIEPIPTSLLVVEPGESVGWVGDAKPIPTHKPGIAAAYALAGEMLGHRITILERGSGAPGPPPPEMFRAVDEATEHLAICAGSVNNLEDIEKTVKAGADGLHVSSLIEEASDPFSKAKKVVSKCKEVATKT